MKQSTIPVGFIMFSIALLYTDVTSSSSYGPGVKQCAFRSVGSLSQNLDSGQIQTCDFQKVFSNSALRVTYHGDMRLVGTSSGDCRRWYITINGQECSSPAPIDAIIYVNKINGINIHRPGTLDGFCKNIPAGRVTVGLSVGRCSGYSNVGDAATCYNSVCRLIIEEYPSMQ